MMRTCLTELPGMEEEAFRHEQFRIRYEYTYIQF